MARRLAWRIFRFGKDYICDVSTKYFYHQRDPAHTKEGRNETVAVRLIKNYLAFDKQIAVPNVSSYHSPSLLRQKLWSWSPSACPVSTSHTEPESLFFVRLKGAIEQENYL
jgi:hypothetical protein